MAKKPNLQPERLPRHMRAQSGGRWVLQPDGTLKRDSYTEKDKGDGTADE